MVKSVVEIKTEYVKYISLVQDNKTVAYSPIIVEEQKGNHANTLTKSVDVKHDSLDDVIEFIVEAKRSCAKDFKFKIRAKEFSGRPIFRFDSAGLAHHNITADVPIVEQKVETPHFHKFNEEGIEIAYRTDALSKDTEREALLNDINLSLAHFCDEASLSYNQGYIEIQVTPEGEITFESLPDNPLLGAKYE